MGHDPLQNIKVPVLGNPAGIMMEAATLLQQVLCYMEVGSVQGCREGGCRQGMALGHGPDDDIQVPAAVADMPRQLENMIRDEESMGLCD